MKSLSHLFIFLLLIGCQQNAQTTNRTEKNSGVKAERFYKIEAQLGEGPIWNHLTKELYWVDIERLQSFTMNQEGILLKILSFNLGMELGQIVALIPIVYDQLLA